MKRDKYKRYWNLASAFYAVTYLIGKFAGASAAEFSWIYLFVYVGIYYILKLRSIHSEEAFIGDRTLRVLAILLSLTIITGIHFDHDLSFENMAAGDFINYLICVAGFIPLCKEMFAVIFRCMYLTSYKEGNSNDKKNSKLIIFGGALVIILSCWFLVWLAYYPGLWNYDPWQVRLFMDHDYNKHHPLIHTLLLGFCYSIGVKAGKCNYGVILYDFIQMFVMAGIFAYTYVYVCRHVSSKFFRRVVLIFYAVFPVHSILAISSTKDTIFSGLVLLCMVLAAQLFETDLKWKRKLVTVVLLMTCNMMLLFRNNAIYAFYIFTICACGIGIYGIYKKNIFSVATLFFSICCILLFQISDTTLTRVLNAKEGSVIEKFSVPSQQFGRIYDVIYESGSDPAALEIIHSYYEMDWPHYDPHLADPMKSELHITGSNIENYIKDSVRLFCRYPLESIDAFLYLTEGYWYINDISNADIYGHGSEGRMGFLLTTVEEDYGIVHESKLPGLEIFMERAFSDNEYQNWPVLSLLFSPALYVWILLICMLIFIKQKDWRLLLPAVFLWALYLTNLLGPCVLIRYSYPFVVCSPLLVCMAIISIGRKNPVSVDKN